MGRLIVNFMVYLFTGMKILKLKSMTHLFVKLKFKIIIEIVRGHKFGNDYHNSDFQGESEIQNSIL